MDDYSSVRDGILGLAPDFTLAALPRFVLNLYQNKKKSLVATDSANQACLSMLEPKFLKALLPFQRLGVLYVIQKQGRCMIADEMGLGKTYQALALADFYKQDWPLLVCTTAATRYERWGEIEYRKLILKCF